MLVGSGGGEGGRVRLEDFQHCRSLSIFHFVMLRVCSNSDGRFDLYGIILNRSCQDTWRGLRVEELVACVYG